MASSLLSSGVMRAPAVCHAQRLPGRQRQGSRPAAAAAGWVTPQGLFSGSSGLPGLVARRGLNRRRAVQLKEAVSTEEVVTVEVEEEEEEPAASTNGHAKSAAQEIGEPLAAAAITVAAASAAAAAATTNGSNGAAKAKKDVKAKEDVPRVLRTGEDMLSPEDAGQLELAAMSKSPEELAAAKAKAAKTPYKNPGGRWNKFKSYGVFQRTCQIWGFALKFAFKFLLLGKKFTYGKVGMTPAAVSERKATLAVWLREELVKLGPTFIKIGQQFSTRVDVLAPEFVKELEQLQDNVPAFDAATARSIVEESLGGPIEQSFDYFEAEPIAAASLGQVHLASIKGEKVVVKVQRPGLKELFDIDCKNIRVLAQWLQKVDPKTDGAARDWVAIYDECQRILYEEIDYTKEAASAQKFKENFKNTEWVKVPDVKWDYTSPKMLTLEYCPGVKINRKEELTKAGMDVNQLARWNVESYLMQILSFGFFHADPHPGNVAVDTNYPGGRLIYYDFGMMGALPGDVKGGLVELFYAVYGRDVDRCLKALITMGVLIPGGDVTSLKRTAAFFLNSFADRLKGQEAKRKELGSDYDSSFKEQRTKDESKARRKAILSNIGEDLLLAANDQPFRFPAEFTFVIRSFTVLDGIGKSLTPKFDISEISAPYARSLLLESNPALKRLQKDFLQRAERQNRAVVNLFKGPNQIEYVSDTMTRMENGELKIRVRALEAERALARVEISQKAMVQAVGTSMLVNVGTVLSVSAMSTAATAAFSFAGLLGLMTLGTYLKVSKLAKKELQLKGQM